MDNRDKIGETEGDARNRTVDGDSTRGADGSGDSVVDLARRPIVKAWTTYVTLLFALIAVGYGLFGILSEAIGEGIFDTVGSAGFEALFSVPIAATPYLAILLAVFVGAFLGWRLERDRSTTYVAAGVSAGVATVVFWVLAALFGSIPLTVSIDIGGLLVNAILAGISAGFVAAGGVWATRTRGPITVTERRRGPSKEP